MSQIELQNEKAVCNMFQNTRTRQEERGILCWRLLALFPGGMKFATKISPLLNFGFLC